MLNGKLVQITGGTGPFGNKFMETILLSYPNVKETGIRPGGKLHEEMITPTDSLSTIDIGKYYAILPSVSDRNTNKNFLKHHHAKMAPQGFYYAFDNNEQWDTVETLRKKFAKVIPGFEVK